MPRRRGWRRGLLFVTPLLLVGLCTLDLVARGRGAVAVIASNLSTLPSSALTRVVDLVHATAPQGRSYRVVLEPEAGAAAARTAAARAQLQLESRGKTRILIVRPDQGDTSRLGALRAVLTGDASLQVVDDRGWVDLGALSTSGAPLHVQVIGLLPGPFGFAALDRVARPHFARVEVTLLPSETPVATTSPRYRIVRAAPVAPGEVLRRATFFVRASPVLAAASLLALAGLCAGWTLLAGRHAWAGIALLVSSVTILHAALLPPLQGADETSQIGTIEWLAADPSPERDWRYPPAIARVAQALEQDRVQYNEDEMLPLGDAAARAHLAHLLRSADGDPANAPLPPAADLQVVDLRAPLFFAPYPAIAGALLRLPVLDRISSYRLSATLWCLLCFVAGLALLRAGHLPLEVGLAYGIAFLLPYAVGVAATCSNYAPAIGLGSLFAAAAVTAILASAPAVRPIAAGIALAAAWAGVPIWTDFLALAILSSAVAIAAVVPLVLRRTVSVTPAAHPAAHLGTGAVALALLVAAYVAWARFPVVNYHLQQNVAAWDRAQLALRAALIAAPLVAAAAAAGFFWSLARLPEAARRRRARAAAAAIALVLVAGFVVTPYAEVPYERVFLPLADLAHAHLASFLASSFSFDQDRLGWKFAFGSFGWHDVYYPEVVYAVARWALALFLIALPILGRDFAAERPRATLALLGVAGLGAALGVATLLARHAMHVHPHGRFALPYLAVVALPVLALVATPGRTRTLRSALRFGVALNVWTAIAVLGVRYYLSR